MRSVLIILETVLNVYQV